MNEPLVIPDVTAHPLVPRTSLAPSVASIFHGGGENTVGGEGRVPPPWSTAANPPWSTATRPLSDIRELTEPSLAELTNRNHEPVRRSSLSRQGSSGRKFLIDRQGSIGRHNSLREFEGHGRQKPKRAPGLDINHTLLTSEREISVSNIHGVGLDHGPGEETRNAKRIDRDSYVPGQKQPHIPAPPPRGLGYTIPNRGHSQSPVKDDRTDSTIHRLPSRTFLRNAEANFDILDFPKHQHPRISIELHAAASLFVGGGSVEGHIRLVIDDLERSRHRRQLAISRISIDLLGVEEMSSSRRNIFLSLATELVDSDNPPPHNMVESLKQLSPIDPFWLLASSISHLDFMLSLPLDVGPPPFYSKTAKIRYVLCATALIRDQGKQYLVRASQEVSILSVYDPEKALMSLPSPLTASDEYIRHKDHGLETIKVTAGLHRQVWVSGTSIFVDVHVVNKSKKTVKRLELQLERNLLCYKHVAASTLEKSASQARVFDSNERVILSKSVMKQGSCGWAGIIAHSFDTRTCDLELPRGHATVKCGKYFEVRYFLNVIVSVSHGKLVTVQLPIVLIHMNSLDVVPNSVAQVAAAIEEKRAKGSHSGTVSIRRARRDGGGDKRSDPTAQAEQSIASPNGLSQRPSVSASVQGRAFAAPRKQSLDRMRQEVEELQELGKILDTSPRKYIYSPRRRAIAGTHQPPHQTPSSVGILYEYHTPPSNRKARILSDDIGDEVADIRAKLRRMRSTETNRSVTSLRAHRHGPGKEEDEIYGLKRNKSVQSGRSKSSKFGFRELDIESPHPRYLRTGGAASPEGDQGSSRFENLSSASARRKMRSSERRKGGGWFGGGIERKESREREREEKARVLANWI